MTAGSERARTTLAFLRRKIASGEWPVNAKIPTEPELTEMIGVGRTTVREAVRSLASLGMLETAAGRGTFVRSRTPVSGLLADFVAEFSLEDILGYRRALEVEACQLAALHRTEEQLAALRATHAADIASEGAGNPPAETAPAVSAAVSQIERGKTPGQFHHILFEATGNRLILSLYAGVMAALRTAIHRGQIVYGASAEVRRDDHAAIIEAIAEQDVARAAHVMALHVDRDLTLPAQAGSREESPSRGVPAVR